MRGAAGAMHRLPRTWGEPSEPPPTRAGWKHTWSTEFKKWYWYKPGTETTTWTDPNLLPKTNPAKAAKLTPAKTIQKQPKAKAKSTGGAQGTGTAKRGDKRADNGIEVNLEALAQGGGPKPWLQHLLGPKGDGAAGSGADGGGAAGVGDALRADVGGLCLRAS